MKKIIAIVLCISTLLSMVTFVADAEGANASDKETFEVWDGSVATGFSVGNGTKDHPYQITSGAHLAFLSSVINYGLNGDSTDYSGAYFKVMNNIDMNGIPFEPIGGEVDTIYFTGYFDGNNKVISNLNLVSTYGVQFTNVGLFGCVKNAVILNLTLKDLYKTNGITAQTHFFYGTLAGQAINSQIINCHVDSDITAECHGGNSQTTIYAGGLVGLMLDGGSIKGCTYDGVMQVNGRGDNENGNRVATAFGGLVGRLDWNEGTNDKQFFFEGCKVSGKLQNVSSTYHVVIGGIVSVGFNGWLSADNVQTETPMVWFKDILVDADIDVSRMTMVNTVLANRYAQCGGIVASLGSYICEMENVHFGGNLIGEDNSYLKAKNSSAFAGIIAKPRSKSIYKSTTTSYDKVTFNAVEYNTTGDPTSGIKNIENWKGKWDENCKTGVSDYADIRESILALIEKGYKVKIETPATVWSGSLATNFSGGTGAKNDPYRITVGGELAFLSRQVNSGKNFEGVYFKLMNDIDMSGIPFKPIGGIDDNVYFSGYFDGDNMTITNLNLMSEESSHYINVGLFGCIKNAVIANVTLKDLYVADGINAYSYFNVGALIGKAISSTVVNCHVKSDLGFAASLPNSQTTIYAGAMIGMIQDGGSVKGCTYEGSMTMYGRGTPDTSDTETGIVSPELDLTGVESIYYIGLGEDYRYTVGNDVVYKFLKEPKSSFLGVCKYFEDSGYSLYGYNEMGNVFSATYTSNNQMMHVYWIGGRMNELCVVKSSAGASALPPKTPAVTTGNKNTVVTQIRALETSTSTNINGMGYVVRLADGSFIIYDGGYEIRLEELWDTLISLNDGEEGIVIRAWLLTHAHGDHYPCFVAFANKYSSKVTLERLLISPISTSNGSNAFNNGTIERSLARFRGAKLLYVHTGMVLNFCDVKMEMLCTASEIYYDGPSNDFNNSSIVSRIYKEGGKSVMFLGDAGDDVSTRLIPMYGNYLESDICQASHHGVEDFTIEAYRLIRSADWLYPCSTALYNLTNRDAEVRAEIRNAEYTKNIYRHDGLVRPVISLNIKDSTKANRVAVVGGCLIGRIDVSESAEEMIVNIEDCIVDGNLSVEGPCYHAGLGGILGIFYYSLESDISPSDDFICVRFKNIFASVDFDLSEIDYSRTPENHQYAKLGGILAWRHSGFASFENCYSTCNFNGVEDFKGSSLNSCKYGGICADGAGEKSTYKNCSTSLDRLMTTAAVYESDGATIKFEKNRYGVFDNCSVGVSDSLTLKENILSNIENGYEINYGSVIGNGNVDSIWTGIVATSFSGGTGTKDNPYIITSGGELALLSNKVNGGDTFAGVYFKLMNNIDMGGNAIEPIGCSQNYRYFSGNFDGNGKTVYNVKYNTQKGFSTWGDVCVGLFGHVKNSAIHDLSIDGDEIVAQGGFFAGAIVGMAVNSQIYGCTNNADFTVSVFEYENQTSFYVGGIVGFAVDGTDVINCINNGTITATGRHTENGHNRSAVIVGGIVGRCDNNVGTDDKVFTIKNCINSGKIVVTDKVWNAYVGGILGFFHNGWGNADSYSDTWLGVQFENVLSEGEIDLTTVDIGADSGRTNNIEIGGIVSNTPKPCSFKNVAHNGEINSLTVGADPQLGSVSIAGIVSTSRSNNVFEGVTTSIGNFTFNAAEYYEDGTIKNEENKKGIFDENCKTDVTETSALKKQILDETLRPYAWTENNTVKLNETFVVNISLKNMPALKSLRIENIKFDESALELVDGEICVSNAANVVWNSETKTATFAFDSNTDINGPVLKLTFKTANNVENGDYSITYSVTAKSQNDDDLELLVDVITIPSKVIVIGFPIGDVNGDFVVDNDDAIYLLRHTLMEDKYPINQDGDMNRDGVVDNDDAIYLLRHALMPDKYPIE